MKLAQGQVYYGIHMTEGVAEYTHSDGERYRIFINDNTIRRMGPSFAGRPVFVEHVDKVPDDARPEADGWVLESFFNKNDGKHWVKFIIVSDAGRQAIKNGFKLSNAYQASQFGAGGEWHAVDFLKEVVDGTYDHLALVNDPRYGESKILTPEQFKNYNLEKETELVMLANSKGAKTVFNIFKREKIENSMDLENSLVVLPKSNIEISIKNALEELDIIKNMHGYANGDHLVKVGEGEMSVNDLAKCYGEMKNEFDELKKKNSSAPEVLPEKKENEKKEEEEPVKNAVEEVVVAPVAPPAPPVNFEKIKNAHTQVEQSVILNLDKATRGRERYGSGN